jgi:hypothetical protein
MATVNYNGMELEEVTEPQIFDPPKKCVVWDDDSLSPSESSVIAIFPESAQLKCNVMDLYLYRYQHCAILPDPPKPRRATNRELARWIAEGKGEILVPHCVTQHVSYPIGRDNAECVSGQQVRKWSDTEWHEPTVDYMGLEDK